jgi:phosphatidylglycerol:prolipoprotein diacylglycerol transferase
LALPYPQIDPVLIQIGPLAIRWYALAYIIGILAAWRYAGSMISRPALWGERGPPVDKTGLEDLVLWITLGIIIGGRLGHVLFYTPGMVLSDPLEILRVWNGGMSFHGGCLGVLVAVGVFVRRRGLDLFSLGDLVCAVVPIGLFLGRIANFINGELWGRPTDLPWAMVFPAAGPEPRHPSQLYEAALEGVLLFLVLRWATHRAGLLSRPGVTAGLFFAGYGLARILVETVREPDFYMPAFPLGLTMGMILSLPMVLGGAWLIRRGLAAGPGAAVDGEGHVAVGAEHHLAAAAAAQETAVSATRHQHHRLSAVLLQSLQPLHQRPADQPAMTLRQFLAHVDQMHRRQRTRTDALRQLQQLAARVLPLAGQPAFKTGRGTAQHQTGTALLRSQAGHIAGVVAGHRTLLLVGAVVLLIEHHQAEPW